MEETGLDVAIERLVIEMTITGEPQAFYLATVQSGELGTGTGPEYSPTHPRGRGTYEPIWCLLADLPRLHVFPVEVAVLCATLVPA